MENLTPTLHYHVWLNGSESKAIVNVRELAQSLPHGSGLDGDWTIFVRRNGDLGLFVEYHQMDGQGSYCGWRTLRASITKVRQEARHPLNTPGFYQILYPKGSIILNVLAGGDTGDWLHECLSQDLASFLTPMGQGGAIHEESGKPAIFSRDHGGWVVAE